MASDDEMIPPHHSPVRSMWARGHGEPYEAFRTLAEARSHPDAALVMEGDCGGQIYLTCPVRHVACDQNALDVLLADLNALSWRDGEGLYFEVLPVGSGVGGGMGGGLVVDGVWLHAEFLQMGLFETVSAVVRGEAARITIPPAGDESSNQ